MMAYCMNWKDCRVCNSEKQSSHFVGGYAAHPAAERSYYERRWENGQVKKSEENPTKTGDNSEQDETNNEQGAITRRRRATYKRWQVDVLEEAFDVNCYPSTLMKKILAARLNMENIQVQVWFQNRRARMKKDGPSSPYTRNYPPSSLRTHLYPQTSPYVRYTPPYLPYDTEILNSINRGQPCSYVTRYPVVSPMFSHWDLDRVLYQQYPRHASSPPRMTSSPGQSSDVTVEKTDI